MYVHHALDPGVGALRSVLSVPVLGAGRAARLYALTLGSRFAILAPDCGTAARLKHVIHDEGLELGMRVRPSARGRRAGRRAASKRRGTASRPTALT